MSRPSDWSALGLGADPTPGDQVVVRQGGSDYSGVADAIARAAATLRSLAAGSSNADSVAALLESRDKVVDDVGKAEGRYRSAGSALTTYAATLDRVQTETLHALTQARSAKAEAEAEESLQHRYHTMAANLDDDDPADADQIDDYNRKESQHRNAASAARSRIATQITIVEQAVTDRDTAAQTAVDQIENTTGSDGLNDSWWDDWGAKVTEWIATIAEAVATIAGILALLVCWIPVIGQALAGILLIVAAVAGIVAALANIALAATGEKSWGEAAVSIVFAILGCIGVAGAARAGAAAFRAMMTQGAKMAGRGAGSRLGAFAMKTLLRRGATGRIALGNTFNNIKGALGEEIINVRAFQSKGSFQVPGTTKFRQPDGVLKLGPVTIFGEAKNTKSIGVTQQILDYVDIARANGGFDLRLFVNEATKTPVSRTLGVTVRGLDGVTVTTFEHVLGVKINAIYQAPISLAAGAVNLTGG